MLQTFSGISYCRKKEHITTWKDYHVSETIYTFHQYRKEYERSATPLGISTSGNGMHTSVVPLCTFWIKIKSATWTRNNTGLWRIGTLQWQMYRNVTCLNCVILGVSCHFPRHFYRWSIYINFLFALIWPLAMLSRDNDFTQSVGGYQFFSSSGWRTGSYCHDGLFVVRAFVR